MGPKTKQKIENLARQLPPEDLEDILQFLKVKLAFHKVHKFPPTAQEWERLTYWQRKAIYWRVRWYVFLNGLEENGRRIIRARKPQDGRK